MTKRYLSGIQPSGTPHLGNYFGAIKQHVLLSQSLKPNESALFFIADLHSLTSFNQESDIGLKSHDVAATYMALGLDTKLCTLFRQSDVPETCELNWMLACVTGMGLLNRAHSYKDKVANGLTANVGLFTYPVLMAADILLYSSTHVPVGQDQVQHVEMTKDMAGSFNAKTGKSVLCIPEAILGTTPKVPGTDGRKMSKSYQNTIGIFNTKSELKRAIKSIVTDSRKPEEPKDPDSIPLFGILSCFLGEPEQKSLAASIKRGGHNAPGYGDLKQMLTEEIEAEFSEAKERYTYYMEDPEGRKAVTYELYRGALAARPIARSKLAECYNALGMNVLSRNTDD